MSENDSSIIPVNEFNPMDFMMTVSTGRFEEEYLSIGKHTGSNMIMIDDTLVDLNALVQADISKKQDFINQQKYIARQLEMGTDGDNYLFLSELTRETHERRHFFDLVSTTIGYLLFHTNWNSIKNFSDFLFVVGQYGESLKLPIREWVNQGSCPEFGKTFIEQYQYGQNFLQDCFEGKQKEISLSLVPPYARVKDYLSGLRMQEERGTRPYLGVSTGDRMVAYPIRTFDILEASAWNQQLTTMNLIGGKIALRIWENLFKQSPSQHYPILFVAFSACKGEREDMSKMLEFALLPPLPVNGRPDRNLDPMQYDPPWRFYTLWQYMLQNRSLNLERAVERLCKDKKWMQPGEVIRDARKHMEEWRIEAKSALGLEHEHNLGLVLEDYINYFDKITSAREKRNLFGGPDDKTYRELTEKYGPPLQRLILKSGKMVFRHSEAVHDDAWVDFYLLSHIMQDAVNKKAIGCPLIVKKPNEKKPGAVLPGDGKCTCKLERDQCHVAEFLEQLGLKVETLRH